MNIIPFERRALSKGGSKFRTLQSLAASGENNQLANVMNIRYTTNITINGVEVPVLLDTGSTDLWVIPPGGVGSFNDTGIPLFLPYGDGSYGVNGTVGIAPFEFGQYNIERQAFLNVKTANTGDIQELEIYGIFGLGLDVAHASGINDAIKKQYGSNTTWGNSVLENLFRQYPDQPNFITMDLSRTDDLENTAGGSFTIGEYDNNYKAVAQAPKLPQYPPHYYRWTTLLDGIYVNGKMINVTSSISGVPQNKTVALLDSGTPTALIPAAAVDQIYSSIPGAVKYDFTGTLLGEFGIAGENWIAPCNGTTTVEFVFGGQNLTIHPLDLSEVTKQPIVVMGTDHTFCVGTINALSWQGLDYDMLLGDSILRNMYTVYNFGDYNSDGTIGNAYMQVLTKTDIANATSDIIQSRSKTLSTMALELSPSQLISLIESDKEQFGSVTKYGSVIILLLATNLVIGLILVVLGILNCRREALSKKWTSGRLAGPHYVPVKFKEPEEEHV